MDERWITFSTPMVRAILENRKTQTRRVVKFNASGRVELSHKQWHIEDPQAILACPYGKPGDRIRVREAAWIWCRKVENGTTKTGRKKYRYIPHGSRNLFYVTDTPKAPERPVYVEPDMVWKYKTARFMPCWASRITLEVTHVRKERVQEISAEDALAEGITHSTMNDPRVEYR